MNNKIQPVTNLANAGKYGTLWQIQELGWRSYLEGAEVGVFPLVDYRYDTSSPHFLIMGKYKVCEKERLLTSYHALQRYEADSLDIPNLSEFLLRQLAALLRPPTAPQPNGDSNKEPQASYRPISGFPITPEQMHPILARIWDFERVPKDARASDWLTLMERMCSIAILEPEGVFEDVPEGIRNQRRIWALVDDLLDAESG
ncbi:MAG: hypothetical protein L6R41_006552 [Letrouitia leprolyta]|nr:MAG: hypothetical protein L6R41_006552 [Letrouitia leprolyta]